MREVYVHQRRFQRQTLPTKFQELMRARVQVQEEFLAGLERDRREWHRYRTQAVKSSSVSAKQRIRQVRLAYGSDQSDGIGSDM